MALKEPIRAAGAVVTRAGTDGTEYLLIHRGYRKDWSFPKGKLDPGEHVVTAAVRETREETGFAIRLGLPLPTQLYLVKGNQKTVHYWHATILEGEFTPNSEVDEIRWVDYKTAKKLLSYDHDVDVLDAAVGIGDSSPLIIMRHTQAMKRADWAASSDGSKQDDTKRPLTSVGRMHANGLVGVLAAFGIASLHSSDSLRCRDTIGPYATARSLAIALEQTVSEERHKEQPEKARSRVAQLAVKDGPLALCTHRPVLPTVLETLTEAFMSDGIPRKQFDPALTPGSMIVIHRDPADLRRVLAVERHIR